ncbi:MAG: S-layer family protein [Cyanobacteria bacterium J06627_28]
MPAIANAQISPDTTLPNNSVVVSPGCSVCEITGGTVQGNNLFHSFESFSVETEAYFNNPLLIENIFSRVTGQSPSTIDGVLRANGSASVFLLNPNGIVFGENASLDIGGSFIATTANQVLFEGGLSFSAVTPQSNPLLSVSTPIGLQFGQEPTDITNASIANLILDDNSIPVAGGLSVEPNRTLALVGGAVDISGGIMFAPSGSIGIGSVGSNSTVGLSTVQTAPSDRRQWRLSYGDAESFEDITLSAFSYLDSSGDGAGSIQLNGRNIALIEGSLIRALTFDDVNGEDVSITASETITVSGDGSAIEVWSEGSGSASNIVAEAANIALLEGAYIDSQGLIGEAGDITLRATGQVELAGVDSNNFQGGLFAEAYESYDASRPGGDVTIETQDLVIRDGAQVSVATFGTADSGDLTVRAANTLLIEDPVDDSGRTGLFNQVRTGFDENGNDISSTGNAGNIYVSTDRLIIRDGGKIESNTFTDGDAGSVFITASIIELIGRTTDGLFPSEIAAEVAEDIATGNGGTVAISTQQLIALNGAQISTAARGNGIGGNLSINASENILLSGIFSEGVFEDNSSGVFVSAEPGAVNDVGTLTINTDTLTVENGAKISADNRGSGSGNNTTINAQQLFVRSGGRVGAGSLLGPEVEATNLGSGGSLTLNIGNTLEVSGSRIVSSDTPEIASDRTQNLINSELFSRAEGAGPAGNVVINETPNGNLNIVVRDRGEISASTVSSTGGNIVINNPDVLLLSAGGRLTAEAGAAANAGDGGNITLNLPDGFIVATPNSNSDIVANAFSGTGGNINITAQSVLGIAERRALPGNPTNDIDASSQFGNSGSVTLNNLETEIDQGLVELPAEPASPFQVAQRCLADSENRSAFVVTGQGGAPPSPRDIVRNETIGIASAIAPTTQPIPNSTPVDNTTAPITTAPLVEAAGWQQDADGTVTLTAQAPAAAANNLAASNAEQYTSCTHQERR